MKCTVTPRTGDDDGNGGPHLHLTAETEDERAALREYIAQWRGNLGNANHFGNLMLTIVGSDTIKFEALP